MLIHFYLSLADPSVQWSLRYNVQFPHPICSSQLVGVKPFGRPYCRSARLNTRGFVLSLILREQGNREEGEREEKGSAETNRRRMLNVRQMG